MLLQTRPRERLRCQRMLIGEECCEGKTRRVSYEHNDVEIQRVGGFQEKKKVFYDTLFIFSFFFKNDLNNLLFYDN